MKCESEEGISSPHQRMASQGLSHLPAMLSYCHLFCESPQWGPLGCRDARPLKYGVLGKVSWLKSDLCLHMAVLSYADRIVMTILLLAIWPSATSDSIICCAFLQRIPRSAGSAH